MAPTGQISWQQKHRMHRLGRIRALPSSSRTVFCGQIVAHWPQPMQPALSITGRGAMARCTAGTAQRMGRGALSAKSTLPQLEGSLNPSIGANSSASPAALAGSNRSAHRPRRMAAER